MNTDIRVSTSFKGHRKRKRLKRLLGPESDSFLIDLWLTVSQDCPDGHMVGWDEIDVADACGFNDDPKKLVDALLECNWIEKDMHGEYAVHDWCIHQAWACKAGERSDIARKAAEARWKNKYAKDAKGMPAACGEDAQCNAPILSSPILSSPILPLPNKKEEKQSPPPAEDIPKKATKRFIPPTMEEVTTYCQEQNNGVDGYTFWNFYEAKDWMLGKNKMKKWKSAVATWSKNKTNQKPGGMKKNGFTEEYYGESSAGKPNDFY